MSQDLGNIIRFLQRLRRRSAMLAAGELLLVVGTLSITLVLLASALGGAKIAHFSLIVLFWILWATVPIFWLLKVLWPRFRSFHPTRRAARTVDVRVPALRNVTLSSLELASMASTTGGGVPEPASMASTTEGGVPEPASMASTTGGGVPEPASMASTSGGGADASSLEFFSAPPSHELALAPSTLGTYSPELVQATVRKAAEQIRGLLPAELIPFQPLYPWLLGFLVAFGTLGGIERLFPGQIEANLHTFFHPPGPPALAPVGSKDFSTEGPALGDITLTFVYPAYLGRETEVLENSNGEVLAPLGTRVGISARAAFSPKEARLDLQLEKTDEPEAISASVDALGRIEAEFTLEGKGAYRFRLVPPDGGEATVSRAYPVDVELDGPPEIELSGLDEVTEVSPNQAIPVSFQASDDHGISRIDLMIQGPDGRKSRVIQEPPPGHDREEGNFSFYPGEWNIPEGASAELWMEARDNDTVSGPKVGKSQRYKIVLSSPRQRREQALAGKDRLKNILVDVLGDALIEHAEPIPEKGPRAYIREHRLLSQGMEKVRQAFTELELLMSADASEERAVFRSTLALRKNLFDRWEPLQMALRARTDRSETKNATSSEREIFVRRADLILGIEKGILSMESFANLQRMESIMASGDEIREAGQSLKEMLEELARTGQDPDLDALLSKVDAMEEKLVDMARQLQQLDRSSAEWFQNPSDETRQVKDALAEIRELLKQGKTEEAMKKLEEYLEATERMMQTLEEMQDQEFGNIRQAMVKDMEGVINGLEDIEKQQQQLLEDTEAIRRGLMEEAGLTRDEVRKVTNEALRKVEEMRAAIEGLEAAYKKQSVESSTHVEARTRELKDRMQTLEAALRATDVPRALREAWNGVRNFRNLDVELRRIDQMGLGDMREARGSGKKGLQAGEELARKLEELTDKMDRMQAAAARRGRGLADRQKSLQRKGRNLADRLQDYSKDSPMIPSGWSEQLRRATQSMDSAGSKLQRGQMQGGAADERVALQELGELRQDLDQAQKEMANRTRGIPGSQSAQGNRGQGQQPRPERWGGRGVRTGEIDISRDYEAPEEYRKEVMEGMKGEVPSRYKRLNRDYYEKLVR